MRRTRWFTFATIVASLALLGAACTSEDTTTSEPPAMSETMAAPGTIPEVATEAGNFTTLLAAVEAADLGETLSGEGPFTVFAPTDDAFAALPEGTVESLLEPENQDQLAAILTYHVVPGRIMAADVTSGEVTTVNGETFTIEATDDGVTITDGQGNTADVTATDVEASNGVIHVVDAVLLPAG
jgi:uncharacterized surface protein with fasciclin (FAS1) repeats